MKRRKLDDVARHLNIAAINYSSAVLAATGAAVEEAERKLKLAALAYYQIDQSEEADKAVSTLLALEGMSSGNDAAGNDADVELAEDALGFADHE